VISSERAVVFSCRGQKLVGILLLPERATARAVVVVVGGPQYRVGSHRQFVLLARELATSGYCTLRFDCRGMGDSEGEHPGFENLGPDISAAIDAVLEAVPAVTEVVLWGLCDAASAAVLYAHADARVAGLVLLNPWVHDPNANRTPPLRAYYLRKLVSAELWGRIFRGKVDLRARLADLKRLAWRGPSATVPVVAAGRPSDAGLRYQDRMQDGARDFGGRVLIILSGEDLVAAEFKALLRTERGWKKLLRTKGWSLRDLPEATHTFSRKEWRDQVAKWTLDWLAVW
jgi:exosortase A-associated hydrolase 1